MVTLDEFLTPYHGVEDSHTFVEARKNMLENPDEIDDVTECPKYFIITGIMGGKNTIEDGYLAMQLIHAYNKEQGRPETEDIEGLLTSLTSFIKNEYEELSRLVRSKGIGADEIPRVQDRLLSLYSKLGVILGAEMYIQSTKTGYTPTIEDFKKRFQDLEDEKVSVEGITKRCVTSLIRELRSYY